MHYYGCFIVRVNILNNIMFLTLCCPSFSTYIFLGVASPLSVVLVYLQLPFPLQNVQQVTVASQDSTRV